MNDPLPDCVGGGGTTVLDESGMLPLAKRCRSCETSAEGGGAITEGAGMFSLEFRALARSGAETGGGSMVAFICTGELESSRLTPPGAGGITFAASAGVERARSRAMFGAGATTDGVRDGAVRDGAIWVRSRAMLGAGGITAGPSAGATRAWSRTTLGAGAISVTLSLGAVSGRSRATVGAGAITDSSCTPLRV
jgi:hypothetical protein